MCAARQPRGRIRPSEPSAKGAAKCRWGQRIKKTRSRMIAPSRSLSIGKTSDRTAFLTTTNTNKRVSLPTPQADTFTTPRIKRIRRQAVLDSSIHKNPRGRHEKCALILVFVC